MATNAAQRLKATAVEATTRVVAIELPKFRYIDDVARFLDKMQEEVSENESLIKVQQKNLAYLQRPNEKVQSFLTKAAMQFMIHDDDESGPKSHLKRKIDPELTKIVVPNVKNLQSQYGLSEQLYEQYRTLEAVETQVAMQFPDRTGKQYNDTMGSIRKLKKQVGDQLKTVLGFLNEVAAKHVPKSFQKYMQAVVQEVQEHVLFEDSDVFLYVSTTAEKELVFTYYLMLKNATNDEGQVTPHLYISLQWIVGAEVSVHVNHEYELPNQLLGGNGTAVGSAGEAVSAISDLLSLEDFATSLGTVPLSTQLRKDPSTLNPGMFTYKSFISKVSVDNDVLTFKLKPGVTQDSLRDIAYALFQEVKQLFRRVKGTKLKMTPSKKEISFKVVNVAPEGEVSIHDAEFLVDKFGLNQQQVRKVVDILNKGEGDKAPGSKPNAPMSAPWKSF